MIVVAMETKGIEEECILERIYIISDLDLYIMNLYIVMTLTYILYKCNVLYYDICRACGAMDNVYGSEVRGSSPGRFVFLRMRQNGVKKNKSQVNRAFLLN